jgi:hypothetical protein
MTTEKEIHKSIENVIDLIALISIAPPAKLPDEKHVTLPSGIVPVIKLIGTFLASTPYEVIEYEEKNFKLELFNRVDIMKAFRRHAFAMLSNACPDCGQSMDTHREEDDPQASGVAHEPPNRFN